MKALISPIRRVRTWDRSKAGTSGHGSAPRIGLLAGSGRFPILFAQAARQAGYSIRCVGIRYEASSDLIPLCDEFVTVSVSRMGRMIREFRRMGVREAVMAGKVTKSVMYTPFRLIQLWPDWRTIQYWHRTVGSDKKDDSLLLGVIAEFARDGIRMTSALDYAPNLLVQHGTLTRRKPSAQQQRDIAFGWNLAKEMGRLDIGQSVAVKECATLAVEAIEGTDRCIHRAGELCRSGGWTLVKVAKPQQDMRFDVPTIGISTIQNLHNAGARVLAVEAGKTILLDQADVVALADRLGLIIIAVTEQEIPSLASA
jgi:DUF1009 family protein